MSGWARSKWRKDSNGNLVPVTSGTPVSIDRLDFNNPLYASGDFVPLYSFVSPANRSVSFTDTAYANNLDFSIVRVVWDDIKPANATLAVMGHIEVVPGTDESVSVKIRNVTDSVDVVEETGITSSGVVTLGPTDHSPTTTASGLNLQYRWKEDNGVNSSDVANANLNIGVQI